MNDSSPVSKKGLYWALEERPEDLIGHLRRFRDQFWTILESGGIVDQIRKLRRFYQGQFYSAEGGRIVLGGRKIDISQLGVNEMRARLRLLLTYATTNDFDWDAQGADSSQDTLEAVKIANSQLDWAMDAPQYRLREHFRTAGEQALIYLAGYTATIWDDTMGDPLGEDERFPGTLRMEYSGEQRNFNPTVFDVVFDPTLPHRKRKWVLFRERANKYDLGEVYFDKRVELFAISDSDENDWGRFDGMERGLIDQPFDRDQVDKWYFMHLPTPALEVGRLTCFAGKDVVLYDGPLPRMYRQRLPLHRTIYAERLDTDLVGHSPAIDLAPLQEALNIVITTALTNLRKFGQTKLVGKKGDEIQPAMLEPGTLMMYAADPAAVRALEFLKDSPQLLGMAEHILQRMDSVCSVSAASRGFTPKDQPAIGAALDDMKTIQANSPFDKNLLEAAQDAGQTILEIWQEKAGEGREMPVVGENDQVRIEKFTSEALGKVRRILVKPGNPALRTPSLRMDYIRMLREMNLVSNEKEILSVLQGSPISRVTTPEEAQIRRVQDENAKLKRGEQVVGSLTDDHLLDIRSHTAEILGDVESRLNPLVVRTVTPHILWHLEQLTKNPMAQALMVALQWAPPQLVAALSQLGAMMPPGGMEPLAAAVGSLPGPEGGGAPGGAPILPGPGALGGPAPGGGPLANNPVAGAKASLAQGKAHLKSQAGGSVAHNQEKIA